MQNWIVILPYSDEDILGLTNFPSRTENYLNCQCFAVVAEGKGMLTFDYHGQNLTINPKFTKGIPTPEFSLGDFVATKSPRTHRTGNIAKITWHFKDQLHLYLLEIGGKLHKSSYTDSELESV